MEGSGQDQNADDFVSSLKTGASLKRSRLPRWGVWEAEHIVSMLNTIFSEFDDLAAKHGVEKIKTIGDAYMAAAGLSEPRGDHTDAAVAFALDILAAASNMIDLDGSPIRLRIGLNTGAVVAGVIGQDRFIYDLWGDTVNMASRMESSGLIDTIQVTQAVKDRASSYPFQQRDPISVKGKEVTTTYTLTPQAVANRSPTAHRTTA